MGNCIFLTLKIAQKGGPLVYIGLYFDKFADVAVSVRAEVQSGTISMTVNPMMQVTTDSHPSEKLMPWLYPVIKCGKKSTGSVVMAICTTHFASHNLVTTWSCACHKQLLHFGQGVISPAM